jgi:hypothetical protein
MDIGGHSSTILGQGLGINTWQVDSLGLRSSASLLVNSEALARSHNRRSRSNSRKTSEDGSDLAKDDHDGGYIEECMKLVERSEGDAE